MGKNYSIICLLALTTLLAGEKSPSQNEGIRIWRRAPGNYAGIETPQIKDVERVSLTNVSLSKRKIFDDQYGAKNEYEGLGLDKILGMARLQAKEPDLLLHFSNGMIVPLAKADAKKVFVALKIRPKNQKAFSSNFPEISKASERFNDPRPLSFNGNKVVYLGAPDTDFSPWKYVSDLTGVEYVFSKPYFAQFQPKSLSNKAKRGYKVFEERCQYCHGVRHVGARFGWDYVEPIPLFEKRDKKSLYYHVKYPLVDALERGLMMPNQENVSAGEISLLWEWIKEVAKKKLRPYEPL